MEKQEKIKIYGNEPLADRIKSFQTKAANHEKSQKSNPFSRKFVPTSSTRLDCSVTTTCSENTENVSTNSTGLSKDDPRYGRPPEGSKTEYRGIKANIHISKEIIELCNLIKEFGEEEFDGSYKITFGELFQLYTVISNKVVGILLRARKHGLLDFPGEMLFQRRDDHVVIKLFPDDDDN